MYDNHAKIIIHLNVMMLFLSKVRQGRFGAGRGSRLDVRVWPHDTDVTVLHGHRHLADSRLPHCRRRHCRSLPQNRGMSHCSPLQNCNIYILIECLLNTDIENFGNTMFQTIFFYIKHEICFPNPSCTWKCSTAEHVCAVRTSASTSGVVYQVTDLLTLCRVHQWYVMNVSLSDCYCCSNSLLFASALSSCMCFHIM